MNSAYISLDFPTVPAPLMPPPSRRQLTQRLNEEAGFLQVYLRDGLNVIQPFQTLERYAGFLTVQYHMLCDQQRYCSGEDMLRIVPHPGLASPAGASRMQADLIDLGAWPPRPVTPAPTGIPLLETLGWLYASEGLMLSLAKLAQANGVDATLGLTATHGGRHLCAPIGPRTHAWRRLAQTLDTNLLSNDQGTEVVAGACQAYHRLDELLSLALGRLN
jgi:heme oxygenase